MDRPTRNIREAALLPPFSFHLAPLLVCASAAPDSLIVFQETLAPELLLGRQQWSQRRARVNVGAILSSPYQTQMANARVQRQTEFQQLGQDLQSGNIAAAQQDFVNLTKSFSTSAQTPTTSSTPTSMAQEFQKLDQDLQSGNLSAAQTDYTQIQRDMQQTHAAHGHHHGAKTSDASEANNSGASNLLNLLTNTATAAASAYGSAGLTSLSAGTSLLSALA